MPQHVNIVSSSVGPAADLLDLEWLLTNGRGSYAAGTAVGVNTRKYHGLLASAVRPPGERAVLLSTLVDEVEVGGERFPLACCEFAGTFHPRGDHWLREFHCDKAAGSVAFVYQVGGARLVKRIALARGADAIAVRYELHDLPAGLARSQFRLRVAPFFAYRHYHANRVAGSDPAVVAEWDGPNVRLHDPAGELPAMRLQIPERGEFDSAPDWWYRFFYRAEADRGENAWEDLFTVGRFVLLFGPKGAAEFHAAVEPVPLMPFADIVAGQQSHHRSLIDQAGQSHPGKKLSPPLTDLIHAGDDFVVHVPTPAPQADPVVSILAGFPWFADWGRDAFISLPGLLLTTGRRDLAFGVLRRFAGAIRNGLVPNRFSDAGVGADYNSVDAGLWFIQAAFAWADATGDWQRFDREFIPAVVAVLDAYDRGTDFDIRVDSDGLLTAGTPSTQVTWMDAMVVPGCPITSRAGKCVEVNALFGHALARLADWLALAGSAAAATYRQRHERWAAGFAEKFPNRRDGGLFDYIGPDSCPSRLVRPNQLFAVSLGSSPLPVAVQRQVVEIAVARLLTPMGLRTLAPGEPGYCPRCTGSRDQRDAAYHQGTVWAWLMGPFVEAYLRVNEFSVAAKRQAAAWLSPLLEHMNRSGCLGQISEIFDAEPPFTPRGAFAQAWSVAEVLR
ncbi:MAG: amylo-alpha-1,6-glucosidase, partial [Phycisphaerae bacterium]|nr:amylo-alpha-1,6-glucosidase [Phycisphaerae bacterium]